MPSIKEQVDCIIACMGECSVRKASSIMYSLQGNTVSECGKNGCFFPSFTKERYCYPSEVYFIALLIRDRSYVVTEDMIFEYKL